MYSHSSYSDLWEAFFGRMKKHLKTEFESYYLFTDEVPEERKAIVPSNFKVVQYDNDDSYTNRLIDCFSSIKTDFCLFQHEDMILYDDVNEDVLEEYLNIVKTEKIDFVKLIKGGLPHDTAIDFSHPTCDSLKLSFDTFQYIIAIQAAIWKKNTFLEILHSHKNKNIWEFEAQAQEYCRQKNYKCYYSFVGTEKKRGKYHWDSLIYPYIATAVYKGKWTTDQYLAELEDLSQEYDIDLQKRGVC